MENDTILTIGLVAVAGYAAYRILNDVGGGIKTTGDAVGGVATAAGQTTQDIFKPVDSTANWTNAGVNAAGNDLSQLHNEVRNDVSGLYTEAKNDVTGMFSSIKNAAAGFYNTIATSPQLISGMFNPSPSPVYMAIPGVNYTAAPANFSSINGTAIYVPPPNAPVSTAGAASSSQLFTPANYTPLPANWRAMTAGVSKGGSAGYSTASSSSSSIIGAPVGTIFKGGASVKSSGASGKYKTTL